MTNRPAVSEQVTFQTEDGLALRGVLHLTDRPHAPAIAVCHPHPQYGGDMYNSVVDAICDAALNRGIAALRFNFRGVGRSEGAYSNGVGEQKDARAALAYLAGRAEVNGERIAFAGYSFGAAIALLTSEGAKIRALACVSTPTEAFDLRPPAGRCPVLFVSGDSDEYSDPGKLQAVAGAIGDHASVVIVPGVDHFWWGADDQLTATVGDFLAEHLLGGENER
jgi:alpha/beta superfamily hydrolase